MVGNARAFRGAKWQWRPVSASLGGKLIGNLHRISANMSCCFSATSGCEQDHVEERPGRIAMIKVTATAAVAANIVSDDPVWASEFVQHASRGVLFTRRVEVAGGKRMMRIGKFVEQIGEMLIGRDTHLQWMIWGRKVHAEAGQARSVRQCKRSLEHAT